MGGKRLNSEGHQFHQYQRNEQSPPIFTELTSHKIPRGKSRPWLGT